MTIYDVLKAENEQTLALLRKLGDMDTAGDHAGERRRLLRRVRVQLESVMYVEAQVLYPLLVDDQVAWAEAMNARRGSLEAVALLRELDALPDVDTDERFRSLARALHDKVRHRVVCQEQRLFPMAMRLVPSYRAQALAGEMHRLKMDRAAELRRALGTGRPVEARVPM